MRLKSVIRNLLLIIYRLDSQRYTFSPYESIAVVTADTEKSDRWEFGGPFETPWISINFLLAIYHPSGLSMSMIDPTQLATRTGAITVEFSD